MPPTPSHEHQFYGLTSGFTKVVVDYKEQIFLSWPNLSACQFLNSNFNYKNLQVGRKKSSNWNRVQNLAI